LKENLVKGNLFFSREEQERIENEVRSNLRYSWQKTAAFIVYYNPPIYEIEEKLSESFLSFIPLSFPNRAKVEEIIKESFISILEFLLQSNNITSNGIENKFIETAILNLKGIIL